MLERFKTAKRAEIDRLEEQARDRLIPPPFAGTRPSLAEALERHGPGAVIAEYKPASPSQGPINPGLRPEDVASAYAAGGASALSVLTEETYFQGSLSFLERMTDPGLPLLRKDFLFHPLQIWATAATPASALLLIVAMFEERSELADMIASCAD
ncbi:MAG: indole-3-glycerol-phosphate synthase, partial [Deltaproteobacteria bacterium]|nr:indole-3-glycerol-phosphate synthase [Deltaproteobacteria bacterium]